MISKVFYTFVYSIVKNMSKKTILVYIGIGCLLAVLAMWSFRSTERRMLEVAEHTFVDAVHQDLDERKKKSEDLISFFSGKTKEKYVNLIIQSDGGKEESHSLKDLDYSRNIDEGVYERFIQTALILLDNKICSDSLAGIWKEKLVSNGIRAEMLVCVNYKGCGTLTLPDSLINGFNSLPSYFAGITNEIKLNAYINISIGSVLFGGIYPLVFVVLILGWSIYAVSFVIWNKRLPLGCYKLAMGIIYNPMEGYILNKRKFIKLPPKHNAIMKALLEAEDYQRHGVDLLTTVWGVKESNMEKLYNAISLLRKTLKNLGNGFDIESNGEGYFRLKAPNLNKNVKH